MVSFLLQLYLHRVTTLQHEVDDRTELAMQAGLPYIVGSANQNAKNKICSTIIKNDMSVKPAV